ncbi:hypothetical protein Pcinc_014612 [Petrolisthes cinctipes]|uniref:Integrase catalytic domain-containing protein n=1 Tax=Petrolisthes cinctipes TaxID=88211 RepID=A0AAE1FUS4_PETCI|nr:hypothetical protein Pcinc_014612 [Petrolisthes cinctipes]
MITKWVSAEDGPFISGIPVEVYDGETPINEAYACSTARSDLQATGPSTSDGQSLRRGKKRKPQTEREEYFKKLKDSHTEINELTMEMMKEKHKNELELLDLRAKLPAPPPFSPGGSPDSAFQIISHPTVVLPSPQLWTSLGKLMGTAVHHTTGYNPDANGMVECFHRTLKAALMSRCKNSTWFSQLSWVILGLRTTPKAI